jgi:hypothetical protein
VWVNSAGTILEGEPHNVVDIPTLILSGSSKIRRGKMVDFRDMSTYRYDNCCGGVMFTNHHRLGRPYNSLLMTCLGAMDVSLTPGDTTFGDPTNSDYMQYAATDVNAPLTELLLG